MTDYRVTSNIAKGGERLDGAAHAFSSDTPILRRFSVKCFATSALSVIKLLGARRQAQDRTQETPGYQKGEEVALRIGSSLRWKKALEDWGQ